MAAASVSSGSLFARRSAAASDQACALRGREARAAYSKGWLCRKRGRSWLIQKSSG